MIALALLLLPADPETAVEAEGAFAQAAQTDGQWTAFRRYSTPDAVIFTPQPKKAHEALPKKDPPNAIEWWPAESYVACDGSAAVNTGPWKLQQSQGFFTTIWVRQADGHHKWVYDGGDALTTPRPRPAEPKVRVARCADTPISRAQDPVDPSVVSDGGESSDGTLAWMWQVAADGSRSLDVYMWNGQDFESVIQDRVGAPK
ncbi:MAG: hypothetical protein ABW182_14020 [Sphingomonas sp.]